MALNCVSFSGGEGLEISIYLSSRGTSVLLPNCLQVLLQDYKVLALISATLPERRTSADQNPSSVQNYDHKDFCSK